MVLKQFDTMCDFAQGINLIWYQVGNRKKTTFIEPVFLSKFEQLRIDFDDKIICGKKEYVRVYWENIVDFCYLLSTAIAEPVYKVYRLDQNIITKKKKYYLTFPETFKTKEEAEQWIQNNS